MSTLRSTPIKFCRAAASLPSAAATIRVKLRLPVLMVESKRCLLAFNRSPNSSALSPLASLQQRSARASVRSDLLAIYRVNQARVGGSDRLVVGTVGDERKKPRMRKLALECIWHGTRERWERSDKFVTIRSAKRN